MRKFIPTFDKFVVENHSGPEKEQLQQLRDFESNHHEQVDLMLSNLSRMFAHAKSTLDSKEKLTNDEYIAYGEILCTIWLYSPGRTKNNVFELIGKNKGMMEKALPEIYLKTIAITIGDSIMTDFFCLFVGTTREEMISMLSSSSDYESFTSNTKVKDAIDKFKAKYERDYTTPNYERTGVSAPGYPGGSRIWSKKYPTKYGN